MANLVCKTCGKVIIHYLPDKLIREVECTDCLYNRLYGTDEEQEKEIENGCVNKVGWFLIASAIAGTAYAVKLFVVGF